jgi:hypothetical protein
MFARDRHHVTTRIQEIASAVLALRNARGISVEIDQFGVGLVTGQPRQAGYPS